MSTLRLTTVFVATLFLAIIVVVLCIALPAHRNTSDYILVDTSIVVNIALLYTGILVIPWYCRNSRYIKVIDWIAFTLGMVPVLIPVLFLIVIMSMGGVC